METYQEFINPLVYEEWKEINIKGVAPGYYILSNFGKVYSSKKKGLLSPAYTNGYPTVQLTMVDGSRHSFYIHRLVAILFIENPDPDHLVEVNHKNFYRDDPKVTNLEWVTKEDNIAHELTQKTYDVPIKTGNGKWGDGASTYGENNGMAKFTESQVRTMLKCLECGGSCTDALVSAGVEVTKRRIKYLRDSIAKGIRWKYLYPEYNIPSIIRT